jgi:DNA-binding CsgD family transcriptional regulator
MSRSAKKPVKKLPVLPKKARKRKERSLLNMTIQLKEVNDRMNLNVDFDKSQFMNFAGYLFDYFFQQRFSFARTEGQSLNESLPVADIYTFSLAKVNRLNSLSARQREVFGLLLKGLDNSKISEKLNIAENTVRNHLQDIYLKLGVPNRYVAITQYSDLFDKLFKKSSET